MLADNPLFALRISDIDQALRIAQNWATHTVSILDTDMAINSLGILNMFYQQRIPHARTGALLHRCYFDDIVLKDQWDLVLATLEDIQAILQFTEQLTAHDKLLVHCSAGISRSTAVATGILCQHGLTPKAALEKVRLIRKGADPNEHIIALMDQALGLNGELEAALQEL